MTDSITNHCQGCNLCCQLLGVVAIPKPPGVLCWFCQPGHGCQIYKQPNWPSECANYACLWLQTRQEGRTPLSMELRPDRSHVVIDFRKRGERAYNVRCDPDYPDAWRQANVQRVLAAIAESGAAIYLVLPTGEERRLKLMTPVRA